MSILRTVITRTSDGSLVDRSGRVLHFSVDRFVSKIVEGDACFVCGRARSDDQFNDEHVIPDWVLRRARVHHQRVTLPNGVLRTYAKHRLPCCRACNSALGRLVEEPISQMLSGDWDRIQAGWTEEKTKLLFAWLALLFVKLHLVDRRLRWHPDPRLGAEPLSWPYNWASVHHAHSVARHVVAGVALDGAAVGTVFIHPAAAVGQSRFDLADLHFAETILLRIDDLLLYAVINDAGIVLHHMAPYIRKLGPLTVWQARELFARLAYCNLRVEQRPAFVTAADGDKLSIECVASDEYRLRPLDSSVLGRIMRHSLGSLVSGLAAEDQAALDRGELTFILRPDGSFCAQP